MRRRCDFDTAVRRGRRAGRRTLVVHAATVVAEAGTSNADVPARIGLVVSKAVGCAVTRNLVKRRLRALARSRVDALPPGTLVVLRANPPAGDASFATLGKDLDVALARVLAALTTQGTGDRR